MATLRAAHAVRFLDTVRVLVIDDQADYRQAMTLLLRLVGYEVMTAANGKLGLDACRTWAPSLVIVDYEMPIMDGLAFLDAKDADATIAAIPVVMVTGSSVDVTGRVARRIQKPAEGTLVLATLHQLVVELGLIRSTRARND